MISDVVIAGILSAEDIIIHILKKSKESATAAQGHIPVTILALHAGGEYDRFIIVTVDTLYMGENNMDWPILIPNTAAIYLHIYFRFRVVSVIKLMGDVSCINTSL